MSLLAALLPIAYIGQMHLYISQNGHNMLRDVAPSGPVSVYDRSNLALYAQLLDADVAGIEWRQGATSILRLDPDVDEETARICWQTHLVRAQWIIGDGLEAAIQAFGSNSLAAE